MYSNPAYKTPTNYNRSILYSKDKISIVRGVSYSLLGLAHFVLLNDFLNALLTGIRRCNLKSDALDIANK